MSCFMLLFLFMFWWSKTFAISQGAESNFINASVYYDQNTNNFTIQTGIFDCEKSVACGYINKSINETGWSTLEIKTNNPQEYNDTTSMYGAGLLEGYITYDLIYWYFYNSWNTVKDGIIPFEIQLRDWFKQQRDWIESQISSNRKNDSWIYTNGMMNQYDGLKYGYNLAANEFDYPPLDDLDFQIINAPMDIIDIIFAMYVTYIFVI